MAPYAYICAACDHPASIHGLMPEGDPRAGPYRCRECGCELAQDAPMSGLNRQGWERYKAARPEVVRQGLDVTSEDLAVERAVADIAEDESLPDEVRILAHYLVERIVEVLKSGHSA